jgi:beta-1,2-mannobiose phosphorylase / 1,2-beta-oligomannan phosphorylase
MLEVQKNGILLKSSEHRFESSGVLNPAAIRVGDKVYLFYRAVAQGNYSTIGLCILNGPLEVEFRSDTPVLFPQLDIESQGVEDARITCIDGTYFMSYTAYDGHNAMGALAISQDLIHFDKKGIVVPQLCYQEFSRLAESKGPLNEKYARYNGTSESKVDNEKKKIMWDKNVVFFPRRINGKLHMLHRIRPDIQIVCFNEIEDLTKEFWQMNLLHFNDSIVLSPRFGHEVSYIGGGCPPIETPEGWLLIYHGVCDTIGGYIYSACAALLDLDNPQQEIARLPYPLFTPVEDWELVGEVNNVCFPTGAVVFDDTLFIYYGAADERIASVSLSLSKLIEELIKNKPNHED